MTITRYRICGSEGGCVSSDVLDQVAIDIQKALDVENVRIDPETRELSYDNPRNCRVDERKLEEAARKPGRDIEFEVCE